LARKTSRKSRSDLQTLGRILQRIHKLQEKYWTDGKDLRGKKLPKISRNNYEYFATSIGRPLGLQTLDDLIDGSVKGDMQLSIENLLMPPLDLDKEFIPVLSLECDLKSSPSTMRICVGMFSFVQKHKPVLFAIRFEAGHFNSNHNFCHGQFTREFEYESRKLTNTGKPIKIMFSSLPDWMPKHIPCIMVPADNPVSLILCTLFSLYGERVRNNISDLNICRAHLSTLSFLPRKNVDAS
jgi:hypothetical protein